MAWLKKLFGRHGRLPFRETLFGDRPLSEWLPRDERADASPWREFAAARQHSVAGDRDAALACLRTILAMPGLTSEQELQAWHAWRRLGEPVPDDAAARLLGIVVEVQGPQGLEVLGVYADGSAGCGREGLSPILRTDPSAAQREAVSAVFTAATPLLAKLEPYDGQHPPPPPPNQARINLLTPAGLHFGQGESQVLAKDPTAAPILRSAAEVIKVLTAKA